MNRRMVILLCIAGVLGAALAWQYLGGSDDSAPVRRGSNQQPVAATAEKQSPAPQSTQASTPHAASSTPDLLPPLQRFSVIWQRTLFSPSRKGQAQIRTPRTQARSPAATPQQTAAGPPDFKVLGVAIGPDGGAVLIRLSARETVRALKGDEVDGWTVEDMSPTTVTFAKGRDRWQVPVGADD